MDACAPRAAVGSSRDASAATRRHALGVGLGAAAGLWLQPDAPGAREPPPRAPPKARLRRLLARAAACNPIDPGLSLDGYGPLATGRVSAAPERRAEAGWRLHAAAERPEVFTLYGGVRQLRFGDWQALPVTYPDGHPRPNAGRVAFVTDADRFDLVVARSASAAYRVLVDGRYLSRAGLLAPPGPGLHGALRVELAPAARPRRVDLEMCSPEGAFAGVAACAGARLGPVDAAARYRIACYGDSFSAGAGCGDQNDAWNVVAGYLLGGVDLDMVQMAIGGSGFVRDGPSWRAIDHIGDLAAQPYDELWIALGANDADAPPALARAAALRFFRAARRILPRAPIVVFGVPRDDSARAERMEATLRSAFAAWGDHASAWVPFQQPSAKLFTGSLEGPGNFTAARYGGGLDGTDNTHPNRAGHRHMGGFAARARRSLQIV